MAEYAGTLVFGSLLNIEPQKLSQEIQPATLMVLGCPRPLLSSSFFIYPPFSHPYSSSFPPCSSFPCFLPSFLPSFLLILHHSLRSPRILHRELSTKPRTTVALARQRTVFFFFCGFSNVFNIFSVHYIHFMCFSAFLDGQHDLAGYCHMVAGLVGEGLTGIFIASGMDSW